MGRPTPITPISHPFMPLASCPPLKIPGYAIATTNLLWLSYFVNFVRNTRSQQCTIIFTRSAHSAVIHLHVCKLAILSVLAHAVDFCYDCTSWVKVLFYAKYCCVIVVHICRPFSGGRV